MILTREQAIAEHRKMWNWIADKTEKRKQKVFKSEYFYENNIRIIPFAHCYCCQYIFDTSEGCNHNNCIINWGESKYCLNGYYRKWSESCDWKESARIAKVIASLPENE